MNTKYFPEVTSRISFEGASSRNPLAFKYYQAEKKVGNKTMAEHLRFAIAYWHTFSADGRDMFGAPSFQRNWHTSSNSMDRARHTLDAAFEFFEKLGANYYCFHDRDIAPEGNTFAESCKNLHVMTDIAQALQQQTGVKLLWGTANLFSHPIYAHGAATNPDAHVFAHAAAQVKHAIEVTKKLGGENYVFWGGREGYSTLLNTRLKQEQEQLARFLHMAVDYKKKIGFTGQFLIEPKPKEPTKHQYDTDSATTISFLREYDLLEHFKLNIEANHATLAGNSFEHELAVASIAGKLGSVDANRGDLLLGWDTDQFPTDIYDTTKAMMIILKQGGLGSGGLNFDAKPRRGSVDNVDLFHAHIGGMDAFAHGLEIAYRIIESGVLKSIVNKRYASWENEIGKKILEGSASLEDTERYILQHGAPSAKSGRQEILENILNDFIFRAD
ncbi:MAG: xylose isomerase [Calditrichia bacterium]